MRNSLVERLDCKYFVFHVSNICTQTITWTWFTIDGEFSFPCHNYILSMFSSTLFAYTFKSINSMFIIWWQLAWNRSICVHMLILLLFWVKHANYVFIEMLYFTAIWITQFDSYLSIIGKNDVVESNVRTVVFPRTTIFSRVTRRIVSSLPIVLLLLLLLMLLRDFEPNIFISITYHTNIKWKFYYFEWISINFYVYNATLVW